MQSQHLWNEVQVLQNQERNLAATLAERAVSLDMVNKELEEQQQRRKQLEVQVKALDQRIQEGNERLKEEEDAVEELEKTRVQVKNESMIMTEHYTETLKAAKSATVTLDRELQERRESLLGKSNQLKGIITHYTDIEFEGFDSTEGLIEDHRRLHGLLLDGSSARSADKIQEHLQPLVSAYEDAVEILGDMETVSSTTLCSVCLEESFQAPG